MSRTSSDSNGIDPAPRARALRRWLVVAALLVAVAAAGLFALRAGVALLERQVAAALGPGAQIGHIAGDWNDVEILDLRIPAPSDWPAPDAWHAERVQIAPSWRSLLSNRIEIASIEITGGYLSALRTRDGRLRLLPSLLESGDAPANAAPTPNAEPAAHAPEHTVAIGEIAAENAVIEFFDATVAQPPWKLRFEQIDWTLRDVVAPALAGHMPLEMNAVLAGAHRQGRVALSGWIDPSTRDLDLTGSLRGADLLALQPYFITSAAQRLAGGALDLDITAKVRDQELHAPGRLTLSQLQFGSGGGAASMVLGVPRDLLLAALKAKGGKIELDFSLDGNIDDPKFSLHEMLATRIAVQLAKQLGFSVGGLVEGIGGIGIEGLKGADEAAGGIGSALRKLIPRGK